MKTRVCLKYFVHGCSVPLRMIISQTKKLSKRKTSQHMNVLGRIFCGEGIPIFI